MEKKAIIAPYSSNPVTVRLKNNTNWQDCEVVELPCIDGEFEVREEKITSHTHYYYVMPMP